jgi:hypothetical protein
MDETITSSENGATDVAQPNTNTGAVTLGEQNAPVLRPKNAPIAPQQSQSASEDQAVSEPEQTSNEEVQTETQADNSNSELKGWLEKKGLAIDYDNPNEVKLAEMQRNAEKQMHEATAKARELETTIAQNPNLDYTGNEAYDNLALQVNQLTIQNRVDSFFRTHPEAREHEQKMAEIVQDRPHLQNDLDALYALASNSPSRTAELKSEGGREALTNLAQKQSAVPPTANASTGASSSREKITPDNVDQQVASHDLEWFKKNKPAIDRAMAGTN